jgi:dienelactone hydrolase
MMRQEQADTTALERLSPGLVLIEAEVNGQVVARTEVRLRPAAAGVIVREVRDRNVTGVFAQSRTAGRQPAIIVLGGSEGGLFTARWAAPLLASRGYAVLGLGYFQGDEPALSALPINLENIRMETLEHARDWLARQPGVDANRVAVVGVSKGAEMALVSATLYPWVAAVGAFAPTHVIWEGIPPPDQPDRAAGSSWTYKGVPLPFVRWSRAAEQRINLVRTSTGSARLVEPHLESLVQFAGDIPAAVIPVERSRAAIFIAAGMDDGMWPAAYSAARLRERLGRRDPGLPAVFEIHPTGHLVLGSGWGPTTQFQKPRGRLQGGNAGLDAQAQLAIWPTFLTFLDEHFRLPGAVFR